MHQAFCFAFVAPILVIFSGSITVDQRLLNNILAPYYIVVDVDLEEHVNPQCENCDSTAAYDSCEPVQDEDEGCTGDDDYRRCVYYAYDYKEVTEHSFTVVANQPLYGETETEDITEHYRWDCESESWESDGRTQDIYWQRWANGNVDAPAIFPARKTWENWDKYTYKVYDSNGMETSSESWGTVQIQTTEVINNATYLLEDTDYTYTEPPNVREGYSNKYSFDNQGRATKEEYMIYSRGSDGTQETDTKIKQWYNSSGNPNGFLNKCKATHDGNVVYDDLCPFPDGVFEEGLV